MLRARPVPLNVALAHAYENRTTLFFQRDILRGLQHQFNAKSQ
jgi:hypothetical protein